MISFYNSQNRSVYTATRATSTNWSQTRIAASAVPISDALNERTGDSILTWLGQATPSLYSKLVV